MTNKKYFYFLTIFVILALAKYFHSIKLQSYDIKQRIFFPLLILFVPVILIFKQPDLGTAIIIFLLITKL